MDYLTRQLLLELVKMREAQEQQNCAIYAVDGSMIVSEPAVIDKDGMHYGVQFVEKNYGNSPALYLQSEVSSSNNTVKTLPNGTADFTEFKRAADVLCRAADEKSRPVVPGEEGTGITLFPTSQTHPTSDETVSPAPKSNAGLDIIGCLSYADQFKLGRHYTRFCFMSEGRLSDVKKGDVLTPCPINQSAD